MSFLEEVEGDGNIVPGIWLYCCCRCATHATYAEVSQVPSLFASEVGDVGTRGDGTTSDGLR
jgi:hypothetical protein